MRRLNVMYIFLKPEAIVSTLELIETPPPEVEDGKMFVILKAFSFFFIK